MATYALKTLTLVPRLVRLADGAECIRFSKQLAALAYLSVRPLGRASRDELVGMLYSDADQPDARRALRQVIYQVRRAADRDLLAGDEVLELRRDDVEVDTNVFRARMSEGDLDGALAVYEQDFLASVTLGGAHEFELWAEGVRTQLAAERRQLLRTLIAREADAARWARAAGYAWVMVGADPHSLDARLRLIELLRFSGDVLGARAVADETLEHPEDLAGRPSGESLRAAVDRALAPPAAGEAVASDGLPHAPEMVGRAVPFHQLVERWKAAVAGRGSAVLVTGEAGIGKTRLARELARRCRRDRAVVLETTCYAIEQTDPLTPFLEAVRLAHAAPGLAGATSSSLEILSALVPEIAARFRPAIQPRVPPIPPQAVSAALRDAFGAIADEAPLALLVEDLHRGSPATIEFALLLARSASERALSVVFTARDQGLSPDTSRALNTLAASGEVAGLPLQPLAAGDVDDLLSSIAELTPEITDRGLAGQLVERTDGIPLYLLELLKELQDTEYLVVRDGRWTLGERAKADADGLGIPTSGSDILRGRLERLPLKLLEILAALAVWGRLTPVETLAEMSAMTAEETDRAVATLERRRLVTRRGDLVGVAHDEIAALALRVAPPSLVDNLHTYAAAMAAEAGKRGKVGEWSVAATHAVAAGYAELAAVWIAHAAREVERSSGREAGREAIRRAVTAAPEPVGPQLGRSLAPVLDGTWSAARWLEERDGTARRRRTRVSLGAAAALVLLGAAAFVLAPRVGESRPPASFVGGAALAIGWGMPGHLDSVEAVRVDSRFDGRPVALSTLAPGFAEGLYSTMIRPGTHQAAVACFLPGVAPSALCLRDFAGGSVRTFARFAGDAAPVGWLPDGSALIAMVGRTTRSGGYAHSLVLLDSTGREVRTIARDPAAYEGAWASPLGDRILVMRVRDRRSEAAMLNLAGDVLGIVDWCDRALHAAWSPDGLRLACVLEDTHLLVVGRAEPLSWPTRITFPEAVESGPVWSADGRYVAVSVGGRRPGIMVVDREGLMEPRRIASFIVAPRLIGWMRAGGVPPLHKLEVVPDHLTLTVGSAAVVSVRGLSPTGETIGRPPPVEWYSLDSAVARVDAEGDVVADRPGTTAVVATYGLRRVDDTAYVRVDSAPTPLLLTENFDHGLNPEVWKRFGDPAPVVRPGVGLDGSPGLLTPGGYTRESGIALRTPLTLRHGLTVEYWASVPVTRPMWQSVKVGLYAAPADSFRVGPGPSAQASDVAAVSLEAPNPNDARRQMMAVIRGAGPSPTLVVLPRRLADGTWHRYRLVIYPDGEVRWFADGVEAMPPTRAGFGQTGGGLRLWTLVVEGRSVGTHTAVDGIKVWRGVVLDPAEPPGDAGRRIGQEKRGGAR